MVGAPEAPRRDYVEELTDSRRWQAFRPRAGDIVVNTPPKAGTTWTQAIVAMLIAGDVGVDAKAAMKSPWIEITTRDLAEVMARLDAQDHRRQVKTHTPFDGIPVWRELSYITVYRHPIDVHFSYVRHARNMVMDHAPELFPDDPSACFRLFLGHERIVPPGLTAVVGHYRETLAREPAENMLRLHYADMRRDLAGTVARIAAHLGIEHPPDVMAAIVEAARFDSMRANADRFTPSAGQGFWRNDAGFFDSATSNKWEGVLSEADLAAYDARISEMLSPAERAWLEWGDGAT